MSSEEALPPDSAAERASELPPQAEAGQSGPVQVVSGDELAPSPQAINQPGTPALQSMPPSLTAARDAAAFVAQLFAQPANAEPSVSEEEELAEPLTDLPDQQPAEAGVPGEDVRTSLRGLEVLVLGLGASGLAMARWCARQGARVTVADTRASPPQLPSLRQDLPDVKFIGAPFSPDLLRGDHGGLAGGGEIRAVFKSPGLSPLACQPVWQSAQQQGLWLGGELDLFVQALRELQAERSYSPKVLAVSGTNGKTTTTALAAALIGHAGKSVCAAGNIGPSLLDALMRCLDEQALPEVWVLELSSFQLEGVQGFEPLAATVLNLSQDHLDWHGDMQAYAAAKARIFGAQGLMILNRDDPAVMAMRNASGALASPARPRPLKLKERDYVSFGGDMPQRPGDYGLEITQGLAWLVRAQPADPALRRRRHEEPELFIQRLIPAGALRIRGCHNATNALAALALAQAAGCSLAPLLFGLREYRGEPHRVEPLGVIQQVEYFDDSKGTNVGATVAALNGLGAERKVVVILGGDGKGQDFSPLASPVAQHARAVVLIGRDAPVIRAALAHSGVTLLAADSLPEAVDAASRCAHAGDAVLLSPACASFDMFDNYEHRAQVFVAAVQALALQAGEVLEARA